MSTEPNPAKPGLPNDTISIEYAGNVIVMSARMWHDAVLGPPAPDDDVEELVRWVRLRLSDPDLKSLERQQFTRIAQALTSAHREIARLKGGGDGR